MGIEVRGSIGELRSQGCSRRNNDINKLELHNQRAKSACAQGASQKDLNNIQVTIFKTYHLVRLICRNPKSLMLHEF